MGFAALNPSYENSDSNFKQRSKRHASSIRGTCPGHTERSALAEQQRAQETPGARCTRSLACEMSKAHERGHHRFTEQSGVSCAMVLTAYSALSPVTGLFCHRRLQVTTCKLDASVGASGPHGFAVRLKPRSSCEAKASTASRPTFVTMANAPLSGGTGEVLEVICPTG